MGILSEHPVTIVLAFVAMVIWTAGNQSKNKKLIYIGILISLFATVAFFLEHFQVI